jgi:hypothetical protein
MATVSILIPARSGEYLGRALVSAQRQSFRDIEIVVGDDTPDGALAPLVNAQGDARIRYVHLGFNDRVRTAQALWSHARGRYVKWLAEADVLMPESVGVLAEALRLHPESALAFHGRVLIDEHETIVHTPPPLLQVGERALIGRDLLVRDMVAQLQNFVGETSNVMIDRQRANEVDLFTYRSIRLDFLTDVATFLNLAARGPLVAVGGYWSMLRLRPERKQIAPETTPTYSAGLYEWELLVRGEASSGALSGGLLAAAAQRLSQYYASCADRLPEIARLRANHGELATRAAHELFDSERFQSDLAQARSAVAARVAQAEGAPAHGAQTVASPAAPAAPAANVASATAATAAVPAAFAAHPTSAAAVASTTPAAPAARPARSGRSPAQRSHSARLRHALLASEFHARDGARPIAGGAAPSAHAGIAAVRKQLDGARDAVQRGDRAGRLEPGDSRVRARRRIAPRPFLDRTRSRGACAVRRRRPGRQPPPLAAATGLGIRDAGLHVGQPRVPERFGRSRQGVSL